MIKSEVPDLIIVKNEKKSLFLVFFQFCMYLSMYKLKNFCIFIVEQLDNPLAHTG